MWCKFSLTGLLRFQRKCGLHSKQCRLYHYKPKDKIIGDGGPLTENVANKDLVLFRYEDPKKMMRTAAMASSCFLMGTFIGYTFYGVGDLVKEGVERSGRREGKDIMYYTAERVSTAGLVAAVSLFGLGAYGLSRVVYSVRRLILRKGGKNVTLVTYGLFGVNSKHVTVPLSSISCIRRAFDEDLHVFLKVKDHALKYRLNTEDGAINNRPLFNRTVGLSRRLS